MMDAPQPPLPTKIPVKAAGRFRFLADRSLRIKLILAFLLMTVFAIGMMALFSERAIRDGIISGVGYNLKSQARTQALTVGDMLAREVRMLQVLSLNKVMQARTLDVSIAYSDDPAEIQAQLAELDRQWRAAGDNDPFVRSRIENEAAAELQEYRRTFPENVELLLTDRYGALVAATNRTSDYMQADEEWWQSAWYLGRGALYIGQPEYDESSQTYALNIAAPVYAQDTNELIGILRTTYQVRVIVNYIKSVQIGETGHADLVLPDGRSLLDEHNDQFLDTDALAHLRASTTPYVELMHKGQPAFASGELITTNANEPAINNLRWTVVVMQDRDESLRPVTAAAQSSLIVALAALIVAGVLAIGMAYVISAPIRRLTQVAGMIASGDLHHRVALHSRDEIGALASSFDTMADSLEQRITTEQQARAEAQRLQEAEAENRRSLEFALAELRDANTMRDQLSAAIRELSSPVLPVLDGVLVMPLVGVIDSERADLLVDSLLEGIEQHHAQWVILDVTGVPIVDTQVAQVLIEAATAAGLLGAQAVLVGLRPELAQTIVGLDIDLSMVITRANLQSGISFAMKQRQRSSANGRAASNP